MGLKSCAFALRWHTLVGMFRSNFLNHRAVRSPAWDHDGAVIAALANQHAGIEPQSGLLFKRPVAGTTFLSQQGLNIALIVDAIRRVS
jgi:hypothetical protein